jgi:hypothetical protein
MPALLSALYLFVQADARVARRLTRVSGTYQVSASPASARKWEADDGSAKHPDGH